MPERQHRVEVVGLRYECDQCGGEMTFTGMTLPIAPPLYVNRCPEGHVKNLSRAYPCTSARITEESE